MQEAVRNDHEVIRTKTLVSFTLKGISGQPDRARYLATPGYKVYKGMFRNRRLASVVRSTWTDDRAQAHPFDSPSEATKLLVREMGPARVANYSLQRVKMHSLDRAITYANGRTTHRYNAWTAIDAPAAASIAVDDLLLD